MKTTQALVALLLVTVPARASFTPQMTAATGSVPSGINYQGRLEQSGVPVNTSVTMVFKVMDAASGGTTLWSSGNQTVAVSGGLFNTVVGMPVDPLIGGGSRWMEVVVNGTALVPREPLNAVPYALVAKTVEGTVDISSNSFNLGSQANSNILYVSSATGRVGIGTTSPAERLHVSSGSAFVQYGVWTSTVALIPQAAAPAGRAGMLYYDSGQDRLNVFATVPNAFVKVATGNAVQQNGDTMSGTLNVTTDPTVTSLNTSSNVVMAGGVLSAPFGVFTGGGSANYSLNASSGINAPNGPVVGQFFVGNLAGVASGSVNKIGDSMTGQLTIRGASLGVSTLTVAGAGAFGAVGASQATLVVQSTSNVSAQDGIASFRSQPGTEMLRVTNGGSVGIGVTAATVASKLHMSSGTLIIDGNAADSIHATGNVGIGTASPIRNLHINSASSEASIVLSRADGLANNKNWRIFTQNSGAGTAGSMSFDLINDAGSAVTTSVMTMLNTGSVGIGLSNPASLFANTAVNTAGLDGNGVNAAGYAWLTSGLGYVGSFVNTDATASGRNGLLIKTAAADAASYPLQVNIGGASGLAVRGDGVVGVGTTSPASRLANTATNAGDGAGVASGAEGLVWQAGAAGYVQSLRNTSVAGTADGLVVRTDGTASTNRILNLNAAGTDVMSVTGAGNVGIGLGLNAPNDKLEVAGGNVRLTQTAGSAGSVTMFSRVTTGAADTCAGAVSGCGNNTVCLGAWTSAGVVSTCATAATGQRCLCAGFGN